MNKNLKIIIPILAISIIAIVTIVLVLMLGKKKKHSKSPSSPPPSSPPPSSPPPSSPPPSSPPPSSPPPSSPPPSSPPPSSPPPSSPPPSSPPPSSPPPSSPPPSSPPPSSPPPSSPPPSSPPPSSPPPSSPPPSSPPSPSPIIGNPFDQNKYEYIINPHLTKELKTYKIPQDAYSKLNKPAAFWIDKISAIKNTIPLNHTGLNTDIYPKWPTVKDETETLKYYLDNKPIKNSSKKNTAVFIVYDLPGRDCNANSSNGELASTNDGLNVYKNCYIDLLYDLLSEYSNLNLVAVIEPDSLPNLATNMKVKKCKDASKFYREGVIYAINKLSDLKNITIYIDAAHGGWLGWPKNLTGYTKIIFELFKKLNDNAIKKIRGFATNTANYQPLGVDKPGSKQILSKDDPCDLLTPNPSINEITYIQKLNETFKVTLPQYKFHYITDTSRNGCPTSRIGNEQCSNWCNIKGTLGLEPTSDTYDTDLIDAYFWLKTPGESDGCSVGKYSDGTKQTCSSSDNVCSSNNKIQFIPSPPAGKFNKVAALYLANEKNCKPSSIQQSNKFYDSIYYKFGQIYSPLDGTKILNYYYSDY